MDLLGWLRPLLEGGLLLTVLIVALQRTRERTVMNIGLAALVLRLGLAFSLYLVSLLHVPIFEHLQLSGGFWVLAPDAQQYDNEARTIVARFEGQNLAGPTPQSFSWVVAMLYEAFGKGLPVILIFNAAVAALCMPLMYWAASSLGLPKRAAVLVAALIGFWPSSILWSGQVLKDALQWLAISAVIAGCSSILSLPAVDGGSKRHWALMTWPTLLILGGAAVNAFLRAYASPVWILAGLVALAVSIMKHGYQVNLALTGRAALIVVFLIVGALPSGPMLNIVGVSFIPHISRLFSKIETAAAPPRATVQPAVAAPPSAVSAGSTAVSPSAAPGARAASAPPTAYDPGKAAPPPSEKPGACPLLASWRNSYLVAGGNSIEDPSTHFTDCLSVMRYAPRALELVFLGPIPSVGPNRTSSGWLMDLALMDQLLLWLLFPGLLFGLARAMKSLAEGNLLVAVYVLALGLLLGLVMANFGTLFRERLQVVFAALPLAVDGWTILLRRLEPRLSFIRSTTLHSLRDALRRKQDPLVEKKP